MQAKNKLKKDVESWFDLWFGRYFKNEDLEEAPGVHFEKVWVVELDLDRAGQELVKAFKKEEDAHKYVKDLYPSYNSVKGPYASVVIGNKAYILKDKPVEL